MSSKRLSLGDIRDLASILLQRAGLNEKASDIVARRIANAERDGCRSHGLFRLPHWHKALTSGWTRRDSIPEVEIRGDSAVAKVRRSFLSKVPVSSPSSELSTLFSSQSFSQLETR